MQSEIALNFRDAKAAGVSQMIDFTHGSCRSWQPARKPSLTITNPPWGNRLKGSSRDDRR